MLPWRCSFEGDVPVRGGAERGLPGVQHEGHRAGAGRVLPAVVLLRRLDQVRRTRRRTQLDLRREGVLLHLGVYGRRRAAAGVTQQVRKCWVFFFFVNHNLAYFWTFLRIPLLFRVFWT